ncbi:response regulator transcription factor [Alkalicoccus saliphilus]|uniref:DNA-binding response regulator n=1 Tax=Alkalicoccus saliphilus TaxID=200989 RepID=A0A2T4U9D7_9BACI|nr:response regulator [Alkalicoccus saliphilus]PTL40011.1 DNA-binding response regulator [Alkalicoccus saliphilus]
MPLPTILIVDDEPRSRSGLKRRLDSWEQYSLNVYTAATGKEALHFLEETAVDLLITDIRMPEMTGLELIEKAKELQDQPVFLVISAYSEFEYAQHALKMGVINYLLKPVKKEAFLDAVHKALEERVKLQRWKQTEVKEEDPVLKNKHLLPETLQTAVALIDNKIGEKFSLKDIAGEVHLNPSYFSVLFKEHTGMTFSDFVTRRRMQEARNLLLTTDLPVADIAEKTGYQTAKYFIQIFKELEGKTPSRYRKEAKSSG